MRTLDPLAVSLAGTHLVEASAGTGKTFTIAILALRLVVEGSEALEIFGRKGAERVLPEPCRPGGPRRHILPGEFERNRRIVAQKRLPGFSMARLAAPQYSVKGH